MSPFFQKVVAVAAFGLLAAGVVVARRPANATEDVADESADDAVGPNAKSPRLLIRRFWFDRLPKKRGDEIDAWLFLGGGIGLEEKGSSSRFALDFFEFERRGNRADLVWFHDKKKETVAFTVVECHDKPPFDVCLDLKEPLRGQKRLYSFDDDADMDANVPWAKDWRAAEELRAATLR